MRSTFPPSLIRSSVADAEARRVRELDEALLLEQVGSGSWRVCDSRIATGHERFLGFVDQKDDGFEVMQLADCFVWSVFPTMRAALRHIVATNPAVPSERPAEHLGWLT